MKYEVILFDADETLFDFKQSEKQAFIASFKEFNLPGDEAECMETYNKINTEIWKEFEQGRITSTALKVERFKRLFKKINVVHDPEKFSKAYMEHLSTGSFIYEESYEILDYLKGKYRLAIITNGLAEVQNRRIRHSAIANYFETIVISDEIKVAKPSAEIFDYTLEKMEITNKNKVLMVGDNLSSDIQGGINAKIDTCWLNVDKKEKSVNMNITYEIDTILKLKDIL